MRGSLAALLTTAAICCAATAPPDARIQPADAPFTRSEMARSAAKLTRDDQIMYIEDMESELLALTNRDARWYSRDGELRRTVRFPNTLWAPIVTTPAPQQPPVIVGLRPADFSESRVDVLALDGRRVVDIEAWKYGDTAVADVLGDAAKEVLVRLRDGVRVYDLRGAALTFVRSAEYLYQFQVMDADRDGKQDLVFWMAGKGRDEAAVQVVTAGGRELSRWRQPSANRLSVIRVSDDLEGLASFAGDTMRVTSSSGALLHTYDTPGSSGLRYVYSGRLPDGRRVFVGTGAATRSVVWVFDPQTRLVYTDRLEGQSWAFAVARHENRFFVGNGIHLWSYRPR